MQVCSDIGGVNHSYGHPRLSPTDIEGLLKWHNGSLSDTVEVAHGQHGTGLYSTGSIQKDDVLLTVKSGGLITVDKAFKVRLLTCRDV